MRLANLLSRTWLRCLILAGLGFVVRMPALSGLPIWDDDYLIGENPFIKSPLLFGEAFKHYLFLDGFSAHYRPMQNVSLGIDYLLWNSNPWGYHLTNVLLHVASGLLLYFLLRRLLAKPSYELSAFFIALIWTVLPVHSAAIDYISGRADSLSFFFASSAWLLCFQAGKKCHRRKVIGYYIAAALCGLLALCSRETALLWFGLFLLHRCFFEAGVTRKAKLLTLTCCLCLLAGYAAIHHLPEARAEHVAVDTQPTTPPERAVLVLRALGDYTRVMVWPTTLQMDRTVLDLNNYRNKVSWRDSVSVEYLSIVGLIALSALVSGALYKGNGRAWRRLGALWFLLTFLPISNLFDLNATVAEHWLYLPSVGFLIFLTGVAVDFSPRFTTVTVAIACCWLIGFSARSYVRSSDWITPKTFYQRTMAAGGTSPRIAVRLGLIYANEGDYEKAEKVYRRVIELWPDYPVARNNLADVLERRGKRAEAEAIFAASTSQANEQRKEYPHTWAAALNLARLRHLDHDDENALIILKQAHADYPQIWEIVRFEAELLRENKGPEAALNLIAQFTQENWWHHDANVSLGRLLWEENKVATAMETFRFASWLDIHEVEALNLLVGMQLQQNRFGEARATQERAVSRQPDEPRQYLLLSDVLQRMNLTTEANRAHAHFEQLQALAQVSVAKN